jgi:hypothetical protein
MIIVIWIEIADIKMDYFIVLNKNYIKFPPGFPCTNYPDFETTLEPWTLNTWKFPLSSHFPQASYTPGVPMSMF